jgi:hypothetical protein
MTEALDRRRPSLARAVAAAAAVLGALAALCPAALAQTIQNPGFETGTKSGWLEGGSANGVHTTAPHSGTYNAYNNGGWNSLFQNVSGLKANTSYTLRAWGRLTAANAGSTHRLYVKVGGVETSVPITTATYQQYSVTFNTGTNTSVEIGQKETSGASATAYFDDFTLTEDTATTPPPTGSGSIVYEYWSNVAGTAVSAIPTSTAPSGTITLNSLEAPVNRADNFGSRIRGYITAPQTGSYTFWVSSDDDSQLKLSTNDQPANAAVIASVTGWTNSREWGKYASQKSAAVNLTAGQKYYVEVLQKEGGGGDNVAVGWSKPGQATTAPSEVIPGSALSPFSGGTTTPPPTGGLYNLKSRLGINLAGPAYWSGEQPFKDLVKFHCSLYDAASHPRDADGWATGIGAGKTMVEYLVLWDAGLNEIYARYAAGDMVLLYDGEGTINPAGFSGWQVKSRAAGRIVLSPKSTTPGGWWFQVTNINSANHVRNLRLVRAADEAGYQTDPWDDRFINAWKNYSAIRFMDWGSTNNSTLQNWSDRPTRSYYSYAGGKGASYEAMIDLCNKVKANAWVCVPHRASDDYMWQMATLWKNNLDPNLTLYVEYSNEVWNWQFQQAQYNDQLSGLSYVQEYANTVARMAKIWREVFGSQFGTRCRVVLAWQYGWNPTDYQPREQLAFIRANHEEPKNLIHGYAVAPYFAPADGGDSGDITTILNNCQPDINGQPANFAKLKTMCNEYGIQLLAYEGGQHIVGNPDVNVANKTGANRDARMGPLYSTYLNNWKANGGGLFMIFSSTGPYSKWGSWGLKEYLDQPRSSAPKYDAVESWIGANLLP